MGTYTTTIPPTSVDDCRTTSTLMMGAAREATAADEADFEDAVVGRGVFCGVAESGGGDEAANGGGGGVFEEVAA